MDTPTWRPITTRASTSSSTASASSYGDYSPFSGPHGTSVAGLIAAAKNGIGTVGVAYDATIGSANIFDPYSGGKLDPGIFINAPDDRPFMEAMRQTAKFDVVNHSWGSTASLYGSQFSRGVEGTFAHRLVDAITFAADTGRGGLRTSGPMPGNIDHAQGQPAAPSPPGSRSAIARSTSCFQRQLAALPVPSVRRHLANDQRTASSRPPYRQEREEPSSVIRREGRLYRPVRWHLRRSPIAAGVVTLMLDANEKLGWRDVSRSSPIPPSSPSPSTMRRGRSNIPTSRMHGADEREPLRRYRAEERQRERRRAASAPITATARSTPMQRCAWRRSGRCSARPRPRRTRSITPRKCSTPT
ncbi:S8 family serine peptidase [Sphingomonas sp. MMS24-JH45]